MIKLSDSVKTTIWIEYELKEKLREASYLSRNSMTSIINEILSSNIDEYLKSLKSK